MPLTKFAKDMEVFSFGQHQDVLTYIDLLKKTGWTLDDAAAWVDSEKERMGKRGKNPAATKTRTCKCGSVMVLRDVNDSPGNQTGDDSKYVWMCVNCMEQIFVKEV